MLDSEVVFTRRCWRWDCSILVDDLVREAVCSFVRGHVGGATGCTSCVSFGSGGVGGVAGVGQRSLSVALKTMDWTIVKTIC
jgi:hypothetical protein